MSNKKYLKGVRLERAIVNKAKAKGLISFRSAGSHSPIDVVVIAKNQKRIIFVQGKANKSHKVNAKKVQEFNKLNGTYYANFIFATSPQEAYELIDFIIKEEESFNNEH